MTFTPTRQGNPCQLCDDTTGKCRQTDRTHLCMTLTEAIDAAPGFKFIGRTKDQLWGKWIEEQGQSWSEAQRETWRQERQQRQAARAQAEAQRQATALSAIERDQYYAQLLSQLSLHPTDQADLIARGLNAAQIQAWGVKSVRQWQTLERDLPHTLPGVTLSGDSLNVAGAGYLCPIRDVNGLIVGFQIRLRRAAAGGRYRWLTSATRKRPHGPTPHLPNGELPLAVHRPPQVQQRAIALVEGTGPKPFILCQRRGQVVIGAAGGQFAGSPQTLQYTLAVLAEELGTRTIEFFPDAGAIANRQVMRQYRSTWELLQQLGYEVRVAWWGQETKAAPDIDELDDLTLIQWLTTAQLEAKQLPAQRSATPITGLTTLSKLREPREPNLDDYFAHIECQRQQELAAQEESKRWILDGLKARFQPLLKRAQQRQQQQPERSQPTARSGISYQRGKLPVNANGPIRYATDDLPNLVQEARAKGFQAILDTSPTGAGKSHTWASLTPLALGLPNATDEAMTRAWWIDQNHRNVAVLPAETNYADMPVRNAGMVTDPSRSTPGGHAHVRHPKAGEKPDRAGNCHQAHLFHQATDKGYAVAGLTSSVNPICGACQFYGQCGTTIGVGYGFRAERRDVFKQKRQIRTAFESMPTPEDHDYSGDVAILEEAGQVLTPVTQISATYTDLLAVEAELQERLPAQHEALASAFRKLRRLVKGDAHAYHGWDDAALREALGELPAAVDIPAIQVEMTPDLSQILGDEGPDQTDTQAETAEIQSLRGKLRRREQKLAALQTELAEAKSAPSSDNSILVCQVDTWELESDIAEVQADISTLNGLLDDRLQSRSLLKAYNSHEQRGFRAEMKQTIADLPTQWLVPFLEVWSGQQPGALRVGRFGGLTITTQSDRQPDILASLGFTVFLDATARRDIIAQHSGIPADKILWIERDIEPPQNLRVVQVTGFDLAGKKRAQSTDQRIAAFTKWAKVQHGKVALFDHLKKAEATGADGWHFGSDTRGSNRFKDYDAIVSVGLPLPDVATIQDQWLTLGGDATGIPFDAYYQHQVDAAMIQEVGRLRAIRRPDEQLTVYCLFDCERARFNYELPAELAPVVVNVAELCPEAAAPGDRAMLAIKQAYQKLVSAGEAITQTAIAAIVGFSQQYVSKLLKAFTSKAFMATTNPIESPNTISCSDPPDSDVLAGVVAALEFAAQNYDDAAFAGSVLELFYTLINRRHWRALWQSLSGSAQIRAIAVLSWLLGNELIPVEVRQAT